MDHPAGVLASLRTETLVYDINTTLIKLILIVFMVILAQSHKTIDIEDKFSREHHSQVPSFRNQQLGVVGALFEFTLMPPT